MRSRSLLPLFLFAIFALSVNTVWSAGEPPKNVDPKADQVMHRFGDFAKTVNVFSVNAEFTFKTTAAGAGAEPQRTMTLNYLVTAQKPDKVRVESTAEGRGFLVLSDGKMLTLYIPTLKKYQQKEAPAQPDQVLAIGGLGTYFLRGFFAPDPYAYYMEGVVKGEYVGQDKVQDKTCDHLKFTQSAMPGQGGAGQGDFEWEVWITQGDQPMLLRLLPNFKERMENMNVDFIYKDWKINPTVPADTFVFTAPAGSERTDTLFGEGGPEPAEALIGKAAPDFSLPLLGGGQVDLKQLRDKVVVLDFWASWCGPCRQSLPALTKLMQTYKDKGAVFYAVNQGENQDAVRKFLDEVKVAPTVALDTDQKVGEKYMAESIPETVIIGKDGTVQAVHVGASDDLEAQIRQEIDALLAGKQIAQPPKEGQPANK